MTQITLQDLLDAQHRIQDVVQATPLMQSHLLNRWLGHDIVFKTECLQTTGSFKLRGASNMLATLIEQGNKPKQVVANSSGNHAQAVAYAAAHWQIPATIYTTKNVSKVKAAATQYYGADVQYYDTRPEADRAVAEAAEAADCQWLPPFNHPAIIAGQGTAALEALQALDNIDAVVAPCGGGGLLSGTLVATRALAPKACVLGAEPLAGNDAAMSLRKGSICRKEGVKTLADGAATPAVGEHTFAYLQQLDGFYEVSETDIAYWSQWLQHLLKIHVEPTSAMTMAAVCQWLKGQTQKQRILVILSGGNIDHEKMQQIWQAPHLNHPPKT